MIINTEGVFIAPWHLVTYEKVPKGSGFIFIHEDTGKTYKETGLTHIVL